MMRRVPPLILAVAVIAALALWPDGSLRAQVAEPFPTGTFVENVPCCSDSSQTCALYLPTSFSSDREWPVLLVFDPRGNCFSAAARFRLAAETYGWIILSSNGTRSDGPWEPNRRAMEALWPEVHGRYTVDHLLRLPRLLGNDEQAAPPDSFEELRQELQIPILQALAAEKSDAGEATQHVLKWIFTQTSFYDLLKPWPLACRSSN